MLINFEKKFIYVRPPKTGSTSIVNTFLEPYRNQPSIKIDGLFSTRNLACYLWEGPGNRNPELHLLPMKLRELLGREKFDSYKKIISVRNPFDHALSCYLFKRISILQLRSKKGAMMQYFLRNPLVFLSQNIFNIRSKKIFLLYLSTVYKPLDNWLTLDDEFYADFYLRTEKLSEDFLAINKQLDLNIGPVQELNKNITTNSEDIYANFLCDEAKEIIFKKNPKTFQKLGYK